MHDPAGVANGLHADPAPAAGAEKWTRTALVSSWRLAINPELVTGKQGCSGYARPAWAAFGASHHLATGLEMPAGPQLQTAPQP